MEECNKRYLLFKDPGMVKTIEMRYNVQFSGLQPVVGTTRITINGHSQDDCKLAAFELTKYFSEFVKHECFYAHCRTNIPKTRTTKKGRVTTMDVVNFVNEATSRFAVVFVVDDQGKKITLFGPTQVVFNAKQELEKKLKACQGSRQSKIQRSLTLYEDQFVCYKENKASLHSMFKSLFTKRVTFVVSEKNLVVNFTCRTMKVCIFISSVSVLSTVVDPKTHLVFSRSAGLQ